MNAIKLKGGTASQLFPLSLCLTFKIHEKVSRKNNIYLIDSKISLYILA